MIALVLFLVLLPVYLYAFDRSFPVDMTGAPVWEKPNTAYCGACRTHFLVSENPPYGVIHKVVLTNAVNINGEDDAVPKTVHLHAVTRQVLNLKIDPNVEAIR